MATDGIWPKYHSLLIVVQTFTGRMQVIEGVSQIWNFVSHKTSHISMVLKAPSGPGAPHCSDFTFTLRHTALGRTPLDEWSAQRRDLYLTTNNTQNRQDFYSPDGIRIRNPSKRADADPRLRRRGHYDRHEKIFSHSEMYARLRGEKPASTSTLPRAHISCGLGRFNYFKLWLCEDDYVAFGKIYWVRVNISMSCNGPRAHCNFLPKRCTLFSGLLF
jgi:hypothetical protein